MQVEPFDFSLIGSTPLRMIRQNAAPLITAGVVVQLLNLPAVLANEVLVSGNPQPGLFEFAVLGGAVAYLTVVAIPARLAFFGLAWGLISSNEDDLTVARIAGLAVNPAAWITMLLSGLVVGVGVCACLIPGVVAGCLFQFVVPAMAVHRFFFIGALERSVEVSLFQPPRGLRPVWLALGAVFVTITITVVFSGCVSLPPLLWTVALVLVDPTAALQDPEMLRAPLALSIASDVANAAVLGVISVYPVVTMLNLYDRTTRVMDQVDDDIAEIAPGHASTDSA